MDIQVSYLRLLINDNVVPYTYTDAQLRSAITLGPAPALPSHVVLTGVLTFIRFPGPVVFVAASMDDVENMDDVTDMDTLLEVS